MKKISIPTIDSSCILHEIPWSNLVEIQKEPGGKVGIIDRTGNYVTNCDLDAVYEPFNGFIAVRKDGKFGFVSPEGVYVSPTFEDLELPAVEEHLRVKSDGKWGYLDCNGNLTMEIEESAWKASDD